MYIHNIIYYYSIHLIQLIKRPKTYRYISEDYMKLIDEKNIVIESSIDAVCDSQGIVVGDRDETGRNTLKVFIPRFMAGINIGKDEGKAIEKDITFSTTKIVNMVGKDIGDGKVKIQNYLEIPCYQIPGISIPRYVKGQLLRVTFADADIKSPVIYPFTVSDNYKKLVDILNIGVPSKPDDADINPDNSYFLEFNSRDQYVRLHTHDANGENNPFNVLIDTKNGVIEIIDNSKRKFEWLVNDDTFRWFTDAGLIYELKENNARLKCDKVLFDIASLFEIKTSKMKITADDGDWNIEKLNIKGTKMNTSHTTTEIKASSTLTLNTVGAGKWHPNILPTCIFSPAHGGVTGGIIGLKGKG